MALNEMDARLISQAEQISELSATDLVSVSRGEGQPSLNIQFGDLVKAVATVMNTDTLFPFMAYGSVDDLNTCVNSGIYKTKASTLNSPEKYGNVSVYNYGGYITQSYISITGVSYTRGSGDSGENWSAWSRIDNFGANTKEELASMVAGVIGTATPQKEGLFPKNRVCVYGIIGQGVTWAKITIPFTAEGDGMVLALNWYSIASNTSTAIANIIRWNTVAVKATLSFGEIVFELKYEVLDNTIILYAKTETGYGVLSATPISIVGNAAISVEPYSGTIPATATDVNVVTIN